MNNIPFTIAMIPIVNLMQESNHIPNNILWWALVLGACFGGNLTMLGASANIVTVGIAKKFKHNKIKFKSNKAWAHNDLSA